ncbi:MAG: hypothetical protein CXZ00_16270 [Acidobacteria bacterium]|nr:MAG: hypothetical protein CXZ00_16270 [Acidobacteriota bacterium]
MDFNFRTDRTDRTDFSVNRPHARVYVHVSVHQKNLSEVSEVSETELEREAIRDLERLERARNAKRSGYTPKRRGQYADHR